jgi:hypothetical protein
VINVRHGGQRPQWSWPASYGVPQDRFPKRASPEAPIAQIQCSSMATVPSRLSFTGQPSAARCSTALA